MTLQMKAEGRDLNESQLSVNPLYAREQATDRNRAGMLANTPDVDRSTSAPPTGSAFEGR